MHGRQCEFAVRIVLMLRHDPAQLRKPVYKLRTAVYVSRKHTENIIFVFVKPVLVGIISILHPVQDNAQHFSGTAVSAEPSVLYSALNLR